MLNKRKSGSKGANERERDRRREEQNRKEERAGEAKNKTKQIKKKRGVGVNETREGRVQLGQSYLASNRCSHIPQIQTHYIKTCLPLRRVGGRKTEGVKGFRFWNECLPIPSRSVYILHCAPGGRTTVFQIPEGIRHLPRITIFISPIIPSLFWGPQGQST